MSFATTLLTGGLGILSLAYPPAAPIIAFLQKMAPYADTTIPLIKSALSEGPAAFEAAKAKAPEFFKNLSGLAASLKGNRAEPVSQQELAVLASHLAGVDPPGWTHQDTVNWWDKATGVS